MVEETEENKPQESELFKKIVQTEKFLFSITNCFYEVAAIVDYLKKKNDNFMDYNLREKVIKNDIETRYVKKP